MKAGHSAASNSGQNIHAQIRREAARAQKLPLGQLYPSDFPVLAQLLRAASDKILYSRNPDRVRMVRFRGQRYGIEQTTLGRIRVMDSATGLLLVAGSPFAS